MDNYIQLLVDEAAKFLDDTAIILFTSILMELKENDIAFFALGSSIMLSKGLYSEFQESFIALRHASMTPADLKVESKDTTEAIQGLLFKAPTIVVDNNFVGYRSPKSSFSYPIVDPKSLDFLEVALSEGREMRDHGQLLNPKQLVEDFPEPDT